MDNELFGEMHEQEENGLYGKRHERELLGLSIVSNNEVSVCECEEPDIFESSQMGYGICLNCSKKVKQTDC